MQKLFLSIACPFALVGAACAAALVQGPAQPVAACADAAEFARTLRTSRSDSASEASITGLADGVSFGRADKIESLGGCALGQAQYNIMTGEIGLRPGVKVQIGPDIRGSDEPPGTVELSDMSPLPESWTSADIPVDAAPSISGYRFVTARSVPGYTGAYVGIWQRVERDAAASLAASFGRLNSGNYSEPRILFRSALPLTKVFIGPALHGDGRSLALFQSFASEQAIRLVTFDWLSARYFE